MKIHGSTPALAILVGIVPLISACGKKAVDPAPTPVAERPSQDDSAAREAEAARRRAEEEARLRAEEEARRMRAAIEQSVFFDYDRADIRSDARNVLDQKVPILREHAAVRLRIEGHADERGSTEYNLALGMRRATSVKEYLAGFGVDASRMETLSFGEERPRAAGHNEVAWSQNRRAEFVVTSGVPVARLDDNR